MTLKVRKSSLLPPLWVLTLIVVGLFLWLLLELKEIVTLLVVGYSIAYLIDPALEMLERRRISRSVGVIVVLLLAVCGLVLLALTALPTIWREYHDLADNFPGYLASAKALVEPYMADLIKMLPADLLDEGVLRSPLKVIPHVGEQTIRGFVGGVVKALLQGYSLTLTLVNLALLPFIVFYLAVDFHDIHRRALNLFPYLTRNRVEVMAREIDQYISAFVRGQLTVGAILFVLYALGLRVIGVELWFLLAFISGFGNMIPYLGFLVGIFLASVMALVSFGDISHLLQVWGLFAVVQALEGSLITPNVLGDKVGLSPLVIILALFAGGSLFGIIGIFLAVPVAAALKVLARGFHEWILRQS